MVRRKSTRKATATAKVVADHEEEDDDNATSDESLETAHNAPSEQLSREMQEVKEPAVPSLQETPSVATSTPLSTSQERSWVPHLFSTQSQSLLYGNVPAKPYSSPYASTPQRSDAAATSNQKSSALAVTDSLTLNHEPQNSNRATFGDGIPSQPQTSLNGPNGNITTGDVAPKRKRGRPPKQKKPEATDAVSNQPSLPPRQENAHSDSDEVDLLSFPEPGSSPRRAQEQSAKEAESSDVQRRNGDVLEAHDKGSGSVIDGMVNKQTTILEPPQKRKRGRPRKSEQVAVPASAQPAGLKLTTNGNGDDASSKTPVLLSATESATNTEPPVPLQQSNTNVGLKRGRKRKQVEVDADDTSPDPKRLAIDLEPSQPETNAAVGMPNAKLPQNAIDEDEIGYLPMPAALLDADDDEDFVADTSAKRGRKPTAKRKRASRKAGEMSETPQAERFPDELQDVQTGDVHGSTPSLSKVSPENTDPLAQRPFDLSDNASFQQDVSQGGAMASRNDSEVFVNQADAATDGSATRAIPTKPSLIITLNLPSDTLEAVSKRPQKRMTQAAIGWANRRKMAAEITEKLEEAARIPMFEGTSRLPCSILSTPGNLILSSDWATIEFWALKQHPPEMPMFSMQTNNIEKDPNVSPRSANPITIRFKGRDTWKGPGQVHVFIVAQSDEGYRTMSDFREKLVEARWAVEYVREPTPEGEVRWVEGAKPFRCDKCQTTFKNKNGLEYHLEKSQTACNPNFVFVEKPSKEKKTPVRKKNKALHEANATIRPKRTKKPPEEDDAEVAGGGNDSDSSVDSIYEWAQQVATKEVEEKSTATRKKYKAFHGENELLQEFAITPLEDMYPQPEIPPDNQEIPAPIELTSEICQDILVEMVDKNGGIFPGDKSAWFALVNVWLLNYKTPEVLAGSKLCYTTLDQLVEAEKLQKVDFPFRDKKSRDVTRSLYLAANYSGGDETIAAVKRAIADAHPCIYVPEAFAPPSGVFDRLQNLVTRLAKPAPVLQIGDEYSDSDADIDAEGTPDYDDDMSLDGMADEVSRELDEEIEEEEVGKTAKKRRKVYKKGGRAADNISKGVIAWHIKRRAEGLEGPLTKKTIRRHERLAGIQSQRALEKLEKEKAQEALREAGAWGEPHLMRLQNFRTGAWSVKPPKRKKRKDPVDKTIPQGSGCAESVTYLQSENGAWCERPFGHGVKPIHARLTKGQDSATYLKTIRDKFRPVVFPPPTSEADNTRQERSESVRSSKAPRATRTKASKSIVEVITIPEDTSDEDFVPGEEPPEEDVANLSDEAFQSSRESSRQASVPTRPTTYFFNPGARRNRNKFKKSAKDVNLENNELDILTRTGFSAPPPLNPGLFTLPPDFGLKQASNQDTYGFDEFETYQTIKFVDVNPATPETTFEDGSWVLLWATNRHQRYDSIRFDGRTNLNMESLPYYAYEKVELEDMRDAEHDAKRQKLSGQLRRVDPDVPMVGTSKFNKIARIKRLIPTRSLTSIEADFDGLSEKPAELAKKLGVEMLPTPAGDYQRKRLRLGNKMNASDVSMFLVAIVVVRVLTGGIDQFVDWIIVQTLFPDYSLNYLDKVWRGVVKHKEKEELLDELAVNFQDAFLVAYQNGTVAKIDYSNLLEYNWSKLVKWTMKNTDTSFAPKIHQITARREDMKEEYFSTIHPRDWSEAQNMYFHSSAPIYRRQDAAASAGMTLDVEQSATRLNVFVLKEKDVIRTWARAAALTPVEMWDSKLAFVKLTRYSNSVLESAISELLDQKVIIKRSRQRHITGRAYEGSDIFSTPLRKPVPGPMLVEAIEYKEFLDEQFNNGSIVEVDYMGDDGSYMCISHLQASGQIIITERDIPTDPMGLGDDLHPYDTKRIPKTKVKWKMEIRPSAAYIYNEDNPDLENMHSITPPLLAGSQALPVWYTILDEVFPEMWKRVLSAVCATITQRTGISTKGLQAVFTPTFEPWELDLLLKWGQDVGLWQPIDDDDDADSDDEDYGITGKVDGWCGTPNWWVLAGSIVRDMDVASAARKVRYDEIKSGRDFHGSVIDGEKDMDGDVAGEMDVDTPEVGEDEERDEGMGGSVDKEMDQDEENIEKARIFAGHVKTF